MERVPGSAFVLVTGERQITRKCSAGCCVARVGLCQWCDERAEARREGFGGHAKGQGDHPRREVVIRAGETGAVCFEEDLDGQACCALIAVLKWMILCEAEAEMRSLFCDICTLVKRMVARTCEGRLKQVRVRASASFGQSASD